jgi:hypothetical protein
MYSTERTYGPSFDLTKNNKHLKRQVSADQRQLGEPPKGPSATPSEKDRQRPERDVGPVCIDFMRPVHNYESLCIFQRFSVTNLHKDLWMHNQP